MFHRTCSLRSACVGVWSFSFFDRLTGCNAPWICQEWKVITIDDHIPSLPYGPRMIQTMSASVVDNKITVPLIEKAMAKLCPVTNHSNRDLETTLLGRCSMCSITFPFLTHLWGVFIRALQEVDLLVACCSSKDLSAEVWILHQVDIRHGHNCLGTPDWLLRHCEDLGKLRESAGMGTSASAFSFYIDIGFLACFQASTTSRSTGNINTFYACSFGFLKLVGPQCPDRNQLLHFQSPSSRFLSSRIVSYNFLCPRRKQPLAMVMH